MAPLRRNALLLTFSRGGLVICLLVLGRPDARTTELINRCERAAHDCFQGFMAVLTPNTPEGIARSLHPILEERLTGEARFILVDPGAAGSGRAFGQDTRHLEALLAELGHRLHSGSLMRIGSDDPSAMDAVGTLNRHGYAVHSLVTDVDSPMARRALALLADPDLPDEERQQILGFAADHYQTQGLLPLLPPHQLRPEALALIDPPRRAAPLADALSRWVALSPDERASDPWALVEGTAGSGAFLTLIERLRPMDPRGRHPAISGLLLRLVHTLVADPSFIDTAFAVCVGATESCDDRVSLVLSQLECALMAHGVASGHHDHQPGLAVRIGRQVFRRRQIDDIARAKVASIESGADAADHRPGVHPEALEVHLAYLKGLHPLLDLGGSEPDALHTRLSGVHADDIQRAKAAIETAEARHFVAFLAGWGPWQQLLERRDPQGVAALKDELADPDVWARVEEEVTAVAREARTPDADLAVTVSTHRNRRALDITRQRWMDLTHSLLDRLDLQDLLAPVGR